jgi:hypothetical protein
MCSFFAANATYLSIIESSLSTDSEVDTVSIWASGVTNSLPFREVCCGVILMAVRSLLVVGQSSSSGIEITRSIILGAEFAGVGGVSIGLVLAGVVLSFGAGLGFWWWLSAFIIPSNFRRAC